MTELILWKNRELERLRRDIERVFRRCCVGFGVPLSLMEFPEAFSVNLTETGQDLILTARLPGMKPEDMDISVTENSLTIKGQTEEEILDEGDFYQRVERRFGSFSRTISLPCRVKVDEIEATYKAGILKITMPKQQKEASRGIRIDVK
ncbi:MAG: Hsp20/alpha crystallin family protein [Deltaproteobacteria bacterium]|nr:Hsp20/alpha crystallin family protein [Deltaproteobacteria bacterium]MBW1959927.1 Hsp20/alpha crystallin family protein [Deltaproteobacteria bacterium]MBW1993701.1 Hsp20/alpha crystallin family protein [Deltaproteobacteria bacterium]MBW2150156.1 Hsp20/alpha crystallin family protein [Deltaproteobacteria bacterium]